MLEEQSSLAWLHDVGTAQIQARASPGINSYQGWMRHGWGRETSQEGCPMSGVFPFPHSLLSRVLCPELTVRHFVGGSPTTREEHGPPLKHGDLRLEQGGWSREPSAEWGRGYCAPSLTRLRIQSRDKGRCWSPASQTPLLPGEACGWKGGEMDSGQYRIRVS